MPKVYGTPTGYQPPDPARVQKKPSTAAQQQQAGKDYLQHMIDAHNAYHQGAPARQVGGSRPRGSSSTAPRKSDGTILRVEKALKDSGA